MEHEQTGKVSIEGLGRAVGVKNVDIVDPVADPAGFERLLLDRLSKPELSMIVSRRACILAAADIRKYEKAAAANPCAACAGDNDA
jgi:indolepyruvate ferredoxin oxidoreductase alpha subunit